MTKANKSLDKQVNEQATDKIFIKKLDSHKNFSLAGSPWKETKPQCV